MQLQGRLPEILEEDAEVGEGGGVDTVAEVGDYLQRDRVAVGAVGGGGFDTSVGGEDVIVFAMENQQRWFICGGGREGGRHRNGPTTADNRARLVGELGQAVEECHAALRKAEQGDVGGGDAVGGGDLGHEAIQLGEEGLQALGVAEGPAHVAEPLAAEAIGCGGGGVGRVDGQGFGQITESGFEGGGELDEVVARGTKTV